MKIYVDGYPHGLMNGHIVKLLEYFPQQEDERGMRITKFENKTTGNIWKSWINGVTMSRNKEEVSELIIGRVKSITDSEGLRNVFDIEIEEGIITSDHVFVKAGEKQKGQDTIKQIFQNEVSNYVKICDPYISSETLQLLKNIPSSIDILILTNTINDEPKFLQELNNGNKSQNIKVKKISNKLHGRYILSQGVGWVIDHSVKDFGSKDAFLTKLDSQVEHESTFDSRWLQAVDYT